MTTDVKVFLLLLGVFLVTVMSAPIIFAIYSWWLDKVFDFFEKLRGK